MVVITNPYARPVARAAPAPQQQEKDGPQSAMGPQSQRRLTLQGRTHLMQSQSHRKKQRTVGQQTLFGDRAFDPFKDCEVCKGRRVGRDVHRAHHRLCYNKRGGAAQSTAAMEIQREEKRLQVLFATPLSESEKCSGQYLMKDAVAGYFAPRQVKPGSSIAATISETTTTTTQINSTVGLSKEINVAADDLYTSVTTVLKDPAFLECHTNSRAPLASFTVISISGST